MNQVLISTYSKELFSEAYKELSDDESLGLQNNSKLAKFVRRFIVKNRNTVLDFVNCSVDRLRRDYKIKETKIEDIIQLQHKVIAKYALIIVPPNP